MTSLGKACCELAKAISANTNCNDKIVIVLLSDGCPTDDYEEGIYELRKQPDFNKAEKFAIAFGDNADIISLSKFVDDNNQIFVENHADALLDVLGTIIGNITPNIYHVTIQDDIDDEWA